MKTHTLENHTVTITANEDFVIIGSVLYDVVGEHEIPGLGKGFDIRDPEGRVDWISAEFFPRMVQMEFDFNET